MRSQAACRFSVVPVEDLRIAVYRVATETPESDATFEWSSTTVLVVRASGGGCEGVGYAYAGPGAARVITDQLAPVVRGRDALDVPAIWSVLMAAVREQTRPGLATSAVSAVGSAVWDLKARVLELPLVSLLGRAHRQVPVYGSGSFTSAYVPSLQAQLAGWVEAGMPPGENEGRTRAGTRPRADACRETRDRIGTGAVRRCERGIHPQAGASIRRTLRGGRRDLVRGAVSSDDLDGLRMRGARTCRMPGRLQGSTADPRGGTDHLAWD